MIVSFRYFSRFSAHLCVQVFQVFQVFQAYLCVQVFQAYLSVQVFQVHAAGSAESFQQEAEPAGHRLVVHL